jgi:DNA-binding CsgD family transcriptional regulator
MPKPPDCTANPAEHPRDTDRLTDIVPPAMLEGLPESAHPWYSYNADRDNREARKSIRREMADALVRIMATNLTRRQRDALLLYYTDGLTEVQIAAVLRISQPTVSQHLTGKKRAGKKVGGALAKLRKGIRRAALEQEQSVRHRQVVAVLNEFLDDPPTRRRAARLFDSLRGPP